MLVDPAQRATPTCDPSGHRWGHTGVSALLVDAAGQGGLVQVGEDHVSDTRGLESHLVEEPDLHPWPHSRAEPVRVAPGRLLELAEDVFTPAVQLIDPSTRYLLDDDAVRAGQSHSTLLDQLLTTHRRLGTAHLGVRFLALPSTADEPLPPSDGLL